MRDPGDLAAGVAVPAANSHAPATKPRPKVPQFDATALLQKMFWTVPETAFMCRVAVRTVWRLMADPKSKFPSARRVRGRTLLPRAEVLAFLAEDPSR